MDMRQAGGLRWVPISSARRWLCRHRQRMDQVKSCYIFLVVLISRVCGCDSIYLLESIRPAPSLGK
ncbi:hypothetical protein Micbo1qcDRAFT_155709, partial [Microdochium bolleyi]